MDHHPHVPSVLQQNQGRVSWPVASWDTLRLVKHFWLVLWNMTFIFFHILGMSSSQLTNSIIFQRGRSTTNQIWFIIALMFWESWHLRPLKSFKATFMRPTIFLLPLPASAASPNMAFIKCIFNIQKRRRCFSQGFQLAAVGWGSLNIHWNQWCVSH